MKIFLWAAVAVHACPLFVEIFPDPVEVSDREGEFVEVRLDDSFRADSLELLLDGKTVAVLPYPEAGRLVLVHDSAFCPSRAGTACALFKESLPNSRESEWRMQAGACRDSVAVPVPKAGRAFQRRAETDDWQFSVPTLGYANADFELGVNDCAIGGVTAVLEQVAGESAFQVAGFLEGCDSALVRVETLDFSSGTVLRDSATRRGKFAFDIPARGSVRLHISVPEDEFPLNDAVDTVLLLPGKPPLVISEVHHCPQEPLPEWVEIYNASRVAFPLSRLRLCGRGAPFGVAGDSVDALQTVLVTKDSSELRAQLGFGDVRIVQVSMGYLNNNAGSVSLCQDSLVLDSVSWNRATVVCPEGFSPLSGARDNSPGFVRRAGAKAESPFSLVLSSRVVRVKGLPLMARIEGEGNVQVRLLDSASREVWRTQADALQSQWLEIPVQRLGNRGVNYVVARQGDFEKVVGIVLRP